ncbi:methyltransferase domain-containing protein [bacterium]|nr:MAG: methyltransferase domain-containing protein [bacterium]
MGTASQSIHSSAFRDFEQAGWENVALQYHDAFARLTAQSIGPLLNAVGAGRGMCLLDVASGPGYVAATAAERGAKAVGVDFSTAMVAQARQRYPNIEFREGDAEALPFPDESFDAVVMNFGLLHLGRPEKALAEMHRVLRSGGRAGFTVWAMPEETVGFGIVLRAIETYGNLNVSLPPGPPFFLFSDPQESQRALLSAGFATPHIVKISQVWRLSSPDALFEIMKEATVRTRGLLRAQSAQALHAIRTATREAVMAYRSGDTIELPMPAVLASAVKP